MKIKKYIYIYRTFGIKGLTDRLLYEADHRSGYLKRRTPICSWEDVPEYKGELGKFFFQPENHKNYPLLVDDLGISADEILRKAKELLQGKLEYFSSTSFNLQYPPNWHFHPITNGVFPSEKHWTEIPDISPELGDIKMVWEMSRFTFVYTLVRAYYLTGDERFAEAFWQAVESWIDYNPPNQGANWKCGQEISLRSIAWWFAFSAFSNSDSSTALRKTRLLTALAAQAERVEQNLRYAMSQRNNHGISEAVGLLTAALMLKDHPRSKIWKVKAKKALESLSVEQIYEDGSYIQHSFNYQRLMLSLYLWIIRLAELNDEPFSSNLIKFVGISGEMLYQLQDQKTGELPNYGSNDGALLFPLSENAYEDYRPIIQAIQYLKDDKRLYHQGLQDEILWWFWGQQALESKIENTEPQVLRASKGGYYTLRGADSFVFTRAATYLHRPSQADNLHLDVWYKGVNIAFDPGTYSYNSTKPWNNGLVYSNVHNTVNVNQESQMTRGTRFLWYDWLTSELYVDKESEIVEWIELRHNAYNRLVKKVFHSRAIVRIFDCYVCIDQLKSNFLQDYELVWNLWKIPDLFNKDKQFLLYDKPFTYNIQFLSNLAYNSALHEAEKDVTRGWRSKRYAEKEPACSYVVKSTSQNILFVTLFGHETGILKDNMCRIQIPQGSLELDLNKKNSPIIDAVRWTAKKV